MGTLSDWLSVTLCGAFWAIGMLAWGYVRRRLRRTGNPGTVPRSTRFGVYLMMALLGLDFGLMLTFGMRLLHGALLVVLVLVNAILAVVVWTFCLAAPVSSR